MNPEMRKFSQNLRKNTTQEENKLWYDFLRQYPLPFRRQVPFSKYILDFYCAQAKLAVELDGSQHCEAAGIERDEARTAFLTGYGLRVVRIPNNAVNQNFAGVCEYLDRVVRQSLSQLR